MVRNKYVQWAGGAAFALALALGGGLLAANTAAAQTPPPATTAPGAGAQTPAAPSNVAPGAPGKRGGEGFGGRGGHGPGGPDGRGAVTTAEGATNAIARSTEYLTLVKSDLAAAQGKMDTAAAQGWLDAANGLLAQASTAQTNAQYGQAGAYAEAARSVANTAELVMAQTLGAANLPSASAQTGRGGMHGPGGPQGTTQTPTQAGVSRMLQQTYNRILGQGAVIGSNAAAGNYLTQAQSAYKTAYTAYGAGNYQAARDAAQVAESLLRASDSLLRVDQAGVSPDAPVNVPAPTF